MSRWTSSRRCRRPAPRRPRGRSARASARGPSRRGGASRRGSRPRQQQHRQEEDPAAPRPPDRSRRRRSCSSATAPAWASRMSRRRTPAPGREAAASSTFQGDRPPQERVLGPEDDPHPPRMIGPVTAIRPEPPDLPGPLGRRGRRRPPRSSPSRGRPGRVGRGRDPSSRPSAPGRAASAETRQSSRPGYRPAALGRPGLPAPGSPSVRGIFGPKSRRIDEARESHVSGGIRSPRRPLVREGRHARGIAPVASDQDIGPSTDHDRPPAPDPPR